MTEEGEKIISVRVRWGREREISRREKMGEKISQVQRSLLMLLLGLGELASLRACARACVRASAHARARAGKGNITAMLL